MPASASQVDLSWTDNADDEDSYRVERSSDGISDWSQIASLGANVVTYSDPGLACISTYYYRIRAYRAVDGEYSGYSNVDQATTQNCLFLPLIIRDYSVIDYSKEQ